MSKKSGPKIAGIPIWRGMSRRQAKKIMGGEWLRKLEEISALDIKVGSLVADYSWNMIVYGIDPLVRHNQYLHRKGNGVYMYDVGFQYKSGKWTWLKSGGHGAPFTKKEVIDNIEREKNEYGWNYMDGITVDDDGTVLGVDEEL
jgi:hypothetical protein